MSFVLSVLGARVKLLTFSFANGSSASRKVVLKLSEE